MTEEQIMALLENKRVIAPQKDILDFLESSYQAGAKLAGWDVKDLEVPKG